MESTKGKTWEHLKEIDISKIVFSAEITSDGKLLPVEIESKIEELINQTSCYSQYLVCSINQNKLPDQNQIKNGLKIIQADTLVDAIKAIIDIENKAKKWLNDKAIHDFRFSVTDEFPNKLSGCYQPNLLLCKNSHINFNDSIIEFPDPGYVRFNPLRSMDDLEENNEDYYEITTFQEIINQKKENPKPIRCLLLGQIGQGKTEYLKYLGWLSAKGYLISKGHQLLPLRIDMKDLITCTKGRDDEHLIIDYLCNKYNLPGKPNSSTWLSWLTKGEILILIDGSNETNCSNEIIGKILQSLVIFPNCPLVISLRTNRFFESRDCFQGFREIYLHNLTEKQQLEIIRSLSPGIPENQIKGFYSSVRNNHVFGRALSNPKLLTIITNSFNWSEQNQRDNGNVKILYDVVNSLLPDEFRHPESSLDEYSLLQNLNLDFLCHLSFCMQMQTIKSGSSPTITWTEKCVMQLIKENLTGDQKGGITLTVSRKILSKLEVGGLLIKYEDGQSHYRFLLNSIECFLAACYLSSNLSKGSGEKGCSNVILIDGNGNSYTMAIDIVINLYPWLPYYANTILILLQLLNDPLPIILNLLKPEQDDLFMHRRCLVIRSISEVSETFQNKLFDQIRELSQELFTLWFSSSSSVFDTYLSSAIISMLQMDCQYSGQPISQYLIDQILRTDKSELDFIKIEETLRLINYVEGSNKMIKDLTDIIINYPGYTPIQINQCLNLLSQLSTKIDSQQLSAFIIKLLKDPIYQSMALRLLRNTTGDFLPQQIIDLIANFLSEKNNHNLIINCLLTIRRFGIGQDKSILPLLIELVMKKTDEGLPIHELERCLAILAISETDLSHLDETEILQIKSEINNLLNSTSKQISDLAISALSRAIANTQSKNLQQTLLNLYPSSFSFFESSVADAQLENLKIDLIRSVQDLLNNQDFVHNIDIRSLQSLNTNDPIIPTEIIPQLITALSSNNPLVRENSYVILAYFLKKSPRDNSIVNKLVDVFLYKNLNARYQATRLLKIVCETNGHPELIKYLILRLIPEEATCLKEVILQTLNSIRREYLQDKKIVDCILDLDYDQLDNRKPVSSLLTHLVEATFFYDSLLKKREGLTQALCKSLLTNSSIPYSDEIFELHSQGLLLFIDNNSIFTIKSIEDLVTF